MKMSGEEIIAAPRQVVWDALNDPEMLKQCITGCEEIKKKSDTEMEAKVTAKVGPVKASFVGAMKLSKLNPPRSYVISGEGKGGMAGFAKGGATVQLSDTADGQTKLSYDVDAQVGGKLAQIGSRLIDSTAKKMAADFFKKFNKVVSERAQAVGSEEKAKPAAKKSAAKKPASKKAATKTADAASATTPAAKKAAKKAATKASSAGTEAKKAAKKTASKAAKTAAAASSSAKASVKSAKTTAKSAAKSAKKATKSATKSASKTASKAAKKASGKAANAASAAVSAAEGAAAEARQTSVQTAAKASNAVESAAASASAGADKVANTMPPQAKSMSTMWMLVMAAAAIGLLLIWASGKG